MFQLKFSQKIWNNILIGGGGGGPGPPLAKPLIIAYTHTHLLSDFPFTNKSFWVAWSSQIAFETC